MRTLSNLECLQTMLKVVKMSVELFHLTEDLVGQDGGSE